ncbi:transposase-like protein [Bradyrhizobium sp. USDA 3315]
MAAVAITGMAICLIQDGVPLGNSDGSLGFWKAMDEVFPSTRLAAQARQRAQQGSSSVQSGMKKALQDICMAPGRAAAELGLEAFAGKYGTKYARDRLPDQGLRASAGIL